MRDGEEKLRLIRFQRPSSNGVEVGAHQTAGKISLVKNSGYSFDDASVYTATTSPGPTGVPEGALCTHRILLDAGQLKIIRWGKPAEGGELLFREFQRKGESSLSGHASVAHAIDIERVYGGNAIAKVVSAHAGWGSFCKTLPKDRGKRRLHVIAWDDDLKKTAEKTLSGKFTDVEIAPVAAGDDLSSRFVTALRGTDGNLKVVLWALKGS